MKGSGEPDPSYNQSLPSRNTESCEYSVKIRHNTTFTQRNIFDPGVACCFPVDLDLFRPNFHLHRKNNEDLPPPLIFTGKRLAHGYTNHILLLNTDLFTNLLKHLLSDSFLIIKKSKWTRPVSFVEGHLLTPFDQKN